MGLSAEQIQRAVLTLIAFVVSVSVHEFGHAFVADRLGDRLPRMQGRVTLSPLAHIDLLGTIILPLAGPFMNLVLAIGVSIVFILLGKTGHLSETLAAALVRYFLALNIALMFFNLIPLPPLDGAAVLSGFLPDALQFIPRTLQRYGTILFFVLFLSGFLGVVMRPAYHLVQVWADMLQRIAVSDVAS